MNFRFWIGALSLLALLSLILALGLTAISHSSFDSFPVAFGLIFGGYVLFGSLVLVAEKIKEKILNE